VPAPVEPPKAQSRVTRSGQFDGSRIDSPAVAGRLQAGRSSSVSWARTDTPRSYGVRLLRSSLVRVAAVSDAELVARCRTGDQSAWNELVERFSRYVYAICVQAFRLPAHDAEDVFQEVFARVYEHLGRLRSDDAIRPWIAQLTRRLCIDRLRAGGRETVADPETLEPQEFDETLAHLDEALSMRASLDAVGDPCKEILDRFFCRDESYRVIGEALGLPAGTIASRISRCLGKLRAELEGRS
jgi:RNA polymerase sigma factor (sigma-70 family)